MLIVLVGCGTKVEIDHERLERAVDRTIERSLKRPEVDQAVDRLLDAVMNQLALTSKGEQLLSRLGEDPALQSAFATIVGAVGEHPTTKRLVLRLMRQHPRASQADIAALFEKRISAVFGGPEFERAFDKAFEVVLEHPGVAAAIRSFERAAANNVAHGQFLSDLLREKGTEQDRTRRLIALNGGSKPDRQRAADLLAETAFSENRLAKFYAELFSLPVMQVQTARACSQMLDAPSFQQHLRHTIRDIITDPNFQKAAIATVTNLLGGVPDAIEYTIKEVLKPPVVATALATLLVSIKNDPALESIGNEALAAIFVNTSIREHMSHLLNDW